ncbi:MAG TPA: Stf0 family sulfotransferase [Anaerolineales bacterium]|nr:Stf0 family sulfotransferase [Anaerolineales bacterium]
MNNFILSNSEKSIFICSTGRSGSSFFIDLMYNTGYLGYPKEYFGNQRRIIRQEETKTKTFSDYLDFLNTNALTENKIFSSKLFPDDLQDIKENLLNAGFSQWNNTSDFQILEQFSPKVYFIWLTRRNKIKQALSLYRSFATNQWRYTETSKEKKQADAPSFSDIAYYIQYVVSLDALWSDFFKQNNLLPLVLVYEDILLNPRLALENVFNFTEVALPENLTVKTEHRKLGDDKNELWYENYLENFRQLERQKRVQRQRKVEVIRFFQKIYYKVKSLKR